ncbi:hypothetical protein TNCV_3901 [Trichonephila clavipes]|nr:hypothetical protein TNCV_3901 [Trichonephila clavipes]
MHSRRLSDIDDSERSGKVLKMVNASDVRRLPATLITSKWFLRWYNISRTGTLFQDRRFQSADEIRSTSQAELKDIAKN